MSSAGLSRRRVNASSPTTGSFSEDSSSRPVLASTPTSSSATHAGTAFERGSKIAYDPRDLEDAEGEARRTGGIVPKLTLMEEVLLLGLKDRQVNALASNVLRSFIEAVLRAM